MEELRCNMSRFRELQDYWFGINEKIEGYGEAIPGEKLESDKLEHYELIGNELAAIGDPGWSIYEGIHKYGEAEVIKYLVKDAIEQGEPEKAGVYWEKFEEVDDALRNPEEHLFQRLKESGMEEDQIKYIREEYNEHVAPLLDGSMFKE